jgi:hypothetical protein
MPQAKQLENCGKLTWGELKALVEEKGISDEDPFDRIDIAWGEAEDVEITYDEDYGWQIYL